MPRSGAIIADLAARRFVEPLALPTYLMVAAAALAIVIAIWATPFLYDGSILTEAFLCLGVFAAIGCGMRWVGFARLGGAVEAIVLMSAIGMIAPMLAVLLAATAAPMADPLLLRADALLFFGFDRHVLAVLPNDWPRLMAGATQVYHTILFQPGMMLTILFVAHQPRRAWRLLTAWCIALGLSLAIMPFVPAVGTPPYSLAFMEVLNGARDGSLRVIGLNCLTGIITFPSFHAAAAVLLGWSALSLPVVRLIVVPLNVAMFASALLVGGHYAIDLVAGGVVAVLGIRWADALSDTRAIRRFRSPPRPAP